MEARNIESNKDSVVLSLTDSMKKMMKIYEGGQVKDHNAGYEDQLDFELTPSSTSFGVTQVDTNITITYEQIKPSKENYHLLSTGMLERVNRSSSHFELP